MFFNEQLKECWRCETLRVCLASLRPKESVRAQEPPHKSKINSNESIRFVWLEIYTVQESRLSSGWNSFDFLSKSSTLGDPKMYLLKSIEIYAFYVVFQPCIWSNVDISHRATCITCGGGAEYFHRSPASRRRRQKGNPVPGDITGSPCSWGI
jgi:hypothetical protein